MSKIDPTLRERLVKLIHGMGYELVGCELISEGRSHNRPMLFRIYLDSQTGVTIDDCSRVSRQVSAMLDVDPPVQGEYVLEVSSPGVNKSLKKEMS